MKKLKLGKAKRGASKFKPVSGRKPPGILLWIAGFAAIGVATLLLTRAATLTYSVEAENGNVTGKATQTFNDQSAGNNGFVTFGVQPSTAGCGLVNAVFCENFEAGRVSPAAQSGDFDPTKISTGRFGGDDNNVTSDGPVPVLPAGIPACRAGSVSNPLPPGETLICDPNSNIQTHYGLTSTASRNYGDNNYRITQPFDIAGRTGTISFDADMDTVSGLWGYPELSFTQEPIAIANYYEDNSRGSAPGDGIEYHFGLCASPNTSSAQILTFNDYRETIVTTQADYDNCSAKPTTSVGHLNRVIIKTSQTHTELYISDFSADGINFSTPKLVLSKDISLNFSQGYVAFGVHNHATAKYGNGLPSWTVLWDNIAFDGPAITPDRNYQVPDNGTISGNIESLGWYLPPTTDPVMAPLTFANVNKSGMTSAKLSLHLWFSKFGAPAYDTLRLNYRLNNNAWHSVGFSAGQLWAMSTHKPDTGPPGGCCDYNEGSENFVFNVDPNELIIGNNTVQFQNVGMSNTGYKPVISDIDLLLR